MAIKIKQVVAAMSLAAGASFLASDASARNVGEGPFNNCYGGRVVCAYEYTCNKWDSQGNCTGTQLTGTLYQQDPHPVHPE